ncbi:hypothetical protein ACFL5V_06905 [Fibrobacterota bacterium]
MKVGRLISEDYLEVSPYAAISGLEEYLSEHHYAVVKNNEHFMGIITEADTSVHPRGLVIDCVTPRPELDFSAKVKDAIKMMKESESPVLGIRKEGAFFGVLTFLDILNYYKSRNFLEEGRIEDLEHYQILRELGARVGHDFNNVLNTAVLRISSIMDDQDLPENAYNSLRGLQDFLFRAGRLCEKLIHHSEQEPA